MYSWGGGGSHFNKGQCGHGSFNDSENPDLVIGMKGKRVVDISCGGYHSVCIVQESQYSNSVYSWGSGYYGQLGNKGVILNELEHRHPHPSRSLIRWKAGANGRQPKHEDRRVSGKYLSLKKDVRIVAISAGGHHTIFLSDKGLVYTCGSGNNGQLGLKSTSNKAEPKLVYSLSNK